MFIMKHFLFRGCMRNRIEWWLNVGGMHTLGLCLMTLRDMFCRQLQKLVFSLHEMLVSLVQHNKHPFRVEGQTKQRATHDLRVQ